MILCLDDDIILSFETFIADNTAPGVEFPFNQQDLHEIATLKMDGIYMLNNGAGGKTKIQRIG